MITLAQVLEAYEYAEKHPASYLRGTTNWCGAVTWKLNQIRTEADKEVESLLLESIQAMNGSLDIVNEGDFIDHLGYRAAKILGVDPWTTSKSLK